MRILPSIAKEASALRQETLLDFPGTRAELIKAMRTNGIAIEDGMHD